MTSCFCFKVAIEIEHNFFCLKYYFCITLQLFENVHTAKDSYPFVDLLIDLTYEAQGSNLFTTNFFLDAFDPRKKNEDGNCQVKMVGLKNMKLFTWFNHMESHGVINIQNYLNSF